MREDLQVTHKTVANWLRMLERRTPQLMVECTWSDAEVDRGLRYLKARFPACPAWQISAVGTRDYQTPDPNVALRHL